MACENWLRSKSTGRLAMDSRPPTTVFSEIKSVIIRLWRDTREVIEAIDLVISVSIDEKIYDCFDQIVRI